MDHVSKENMIRILIQIEKGDVLITKDSAMVKSYS